MGLVCLKSGAEGTEDGLDVVDKLLNTPQRDRRAIAQDVEGGSSGIETTNDARIRGRITVRGEDVGANFVVRGIRNPTGVGETLGRLVIFNQTVVDDRKTGKGRRVISPCSP